MLIVDFDEQDHLTAHEPAIDSGPPRAKAFPPDEGSKSQPRVEHLLTADECLRLHGSNAANGLTSAQHARLLVVHGRNLLTPPKKTPLCLLFLAHLTGFFSLLFLRLMAIVEAALYCLFFL